VRWSSVCWLHAGVCVCVGGGVNSNPVVSLPLRQQILQASTPRLHTPTHKPALWFLFLMVYGAFPIQFATDLHRFFVGAIGNALFFWLAVIIAPLTCVLPLFAARQLQRYLTPAYYQVVQEIAARERTGEVVLAGGLPSKVAARPPGVTARASRLMARKTMKAAATSAGGAAVSAVLRRRYSGFVPPYEARSRVFDSNELRASALAAGYTISNTGEIIDPLPTRATTVSGATGELLHLPPSPGPRSTLGPFGAGAALARALSGIGAVSLGRHRPRGSMAGTLFSSSGAGMSSPGLISTGGGWAVPMSPGATIMSSSGLLLPGAAAVASLSGSGGFQPSSPGLTRLSVGASGGGAGGAEFLLSTSGEGAVPSVAADDSTYASNPVLAQLEREFSRDPRRHKRGTRLSMLSISNLPRCACAGLGLGVEALGDCCL